MELTITKLCKKIKLYEREMQSNEKKIKIKDGKIQKLKHNLFSSNSESIETGNTIRAAEQYVRKLEKARKFRFLQMEEDLKLLNNIATTNKCEERKNIILLNEITIKDSIIEDL